MPQRRISRELLATIFVVVLAISVAGCAGVRHETKAGTYDGPPRAIGGGEARTFITLDNNGNPTAIGIKMSEAALKSLPAEPPRDVPGWEYSLSFPREAAVAGYNHATIDFNPKGHIPPGVYDKPHFDFHFYLITPEEREKITAVGDDLARAHKAPPPEFMPSGYQLPEGTEQARMGAHAIDPGAPEFNKLPFTKTFIYGFYDGQMIFLEPMVTKAFLETRANATESIKLPRSYQRHAYYPTKFSVNYDSVRREYVIALGDLVSR